MSAADMLDDALDLEPLECATCRGTGEEVTLDQHGHPTTDVCVACNGYGELT